MISYAEPSFVNNMGKLQERNAEENWGSSHGDGEEDTDGDTVLRGYPIDEQEWSIITPQFWHEIKYLLLLYLKGGNLGWQCLGSRKKMVMLLFLGNVQLSHPCSFDSGNSNSLTRLSSSLSGELLLYPPNIMI